MLHVLRAMPATHATYYPEMAREAGLDQKKMNNSQTLLKSSVCIDKHMRNMLDQQEKDLWKHSGCGLALMLWLLVCLC